MTAEDVMNQYFKEDEMCRLLDIEMPTLQSRRSRGNDHPPYIKIGRQVLYPKDKYVAWLKAQPLKAQLNRPGLKLVK